MSYLKDQDKPMHVLSSLVTKRQGLGSKVLGGSHDKRERAVLPSKKELLVLTAHQRLHRYKLLPKAMKGKMNVAVTLNPTRLGHFNVTCCKCRFMDVVLDMDLFLHLKSKTLFSFFKKKILLKVT